MQQTQRKPRHAVRLDADADGVVVGGYRRCIANRDNHVVGGTIRMRASMSSITQLKHKTHSIVVQKQRASPIEGRPFRCCRCY